MSWHSLPLVHGENLPFRQQTARKLRGKNHQEEAVPEESFNEGRTLILRFYCLETLRQQLEARGDGKKRLRDGAFLKYNVVTIAGRESQAQFYEVAMVGVDYL